MSSTAREDGKDGAKITRKLARRPATLLKGSVKRKRDNVQN